MRFRQPTLHLLLLLSLVACAPMATSAFSTEAPTAVAAPQILRLATTTSTADSGLLDALLPNFELKYNAHVDVIAVGTGQAIALGTNGDVDVVLVHARSRENAFVESGDGINRLEVMYNDFVLVGPTADPAGVRGVATGQDALAKIAETQSPFASRGDDSGTHTKEKSLWLSAGLTPTLDSGWYFSLGQGMGETLLFANEQGAYTLTDRGTWLAQKANLPNLTIVVGGASIAENLDKGLLNPYGIILVNPDKHAGVNFDLAVQFANWLTSKPTQQMIGDYGRDQFGQSLFYPSSEAWEAAHP